MTACEHRIGDHQFVWLHGSPEASRQQVEVLARAGVEGCALWLKGVRPEPFTLRSGVDCQSFDHAAAMYAWYRDSIGQDPVDLIWSDWDAAADGFQVVVLEVRRVQTTGLLASVGGLNPPSAAWLECDWKLIAVPIDEE
jgi:hypothetical protein